MEEKLPIRILLVEDDHYIAKVISLGMQSLGVPYHIDQASSAEEGIDLWEQHPYDIILTDYNLRGINGVHMLEMLRQRGSTAPTVLFTAFDSQQTRREAVSANVSAYIAKPFLIDEFVNLTRSLLPAHAAALGS